MPAISVVLPFRNAEATIAEAVASTLSQTFADFEIVAVDDGSTDRSWEIVRELGDSRVRVVASGGGLVASLNLGIEAARGELIARMDADDVMLSKRLELQQRFLASHGDVDVVGSQVELFPDEIVEAGYREYVRWQNLCVTPDEIAAQIYVESPLAHPSVMMRKSALLAAGAYRSGDFPEDYDLWLRFHARGHRMAKVPQVLLRWRESAFRTSRVDARYSRNAFDRLRAHYLARDPRLQRRELVFWGAGRKTRLRTRHAVATGLRPAAYIDIDPKKVGRRIDNVPVHPPDWLQQSVRPFVLIWVTAHGAREEIVGRLEAFGYRIGEDFLAVG